MTDRYGFSDTVMDHFFHPRHVGSLPDASGEGWAGSPDTGRYMRIQVRLEGRIVAESRFGTYGCAPAIAAGSFICEWACGRAIDEVMAYTPTRLLRSLGWLPKHRRYCADLAVEALHTAISDALFRQAPAVDPAPTLGQDLEVVACGLPGVLSETALGARTDE